jgi:hypothetical protein
VSIVTDFRSIRRKLERQEQKADFEEKNPKPAMTVVWTPEWGYGSLSPADVNAMARAYLVRRRDAELLASVPVFGPPPIAGNS